MDKIKYPRQITQIIHEKVFNELSTEIFNLANNKYELRDWQFEVEFGVSTVQIFIDYKNSAEVKILPDDCFAVHKMIMGVNVLNIFADDIVIEVSSPGIEPYLRKTEHFLLAINQKIKIELWSGIIEGMKKDTEYKVIACENYLLKIEDNCLQNFVIALSDIKKAILCAKKEVTTKRK